MASEPRPARPSSLIVFVVAFAIAVAVHLVVGSLFGTPQGRRLDPNSWGLQTFMLGIGLASAWRGFKQKRIQITVPSVFIAGLAVIWIAQTG
jgi:hypothetical protein